MGIFRLGDTSSRAKYQIALLNTTLEIISKFNNNNELISAEELYDILYELGLKKLREPEKPKSNVIRLLLKTPKWFKLIEYKEKKIQLTQTGEELLNYQKQEFDKKTINSLKTLQFNIYNLSWLDKVLAWKIPNSAKFTDIDPDYSPFCSLIYKVITSNGKIEFDWLKNWMRNSRKISFHENNNDIFHLEKYQKDINEYRFAKPIKNNEIFYDFIKKIKEDDKSSAKVFLKDALVKLDGTDKVYLYIKNICEKFLDEKLKILTKKKVYKKILDNFDLIWDRMKKYTGFNLDDLIHTVIEETTVEKDYFDINKRWIEELGIGTFNKNRDLICNESKVLFFRKLSERIDFSKQGANYQEGEMKSVIFEKNFLSDLFEKLNFSYKENAIPFNKDDCLNVIRKFVESKKLKKWENFNSTIEEYEINGNVSNAAIIEYFVSLYFWFTLKEKFQDISSFAESCNTIMDADLFPITHAPGGMADCVIFANNKNYIVEISIIDSLIALHRNESESIIRHSLKVIDKNGKKVNLFLVIFKKIEKHDKLVNFFINDYNDDVRYHPKDFINYQTITFASLEDIELN